MNHEKLNQLENELFEVRLKIETILNRSQKLCPTEINQICTELQAITEDIRIALTSMDNG